MRERLWGRRRGDDPTAEWHAILDKARMTTVCGTPLEPPYETRTDDPGFRDPACAQCFARATDLVGVEEVDRDARELGRRGDVVMRQPG